MTTEAIEWIAVEDRLPDDGETVMLAFKDGECWPGFRADGGWCDSGSAVEVGGVTHWAAMPAGPR